MVNIEREPLPGIGINFTIKTESGDRIGVIRHHAGHRAGVRDVILYDGDDPDRVSRTVTLNRQEAHFIAEMLEPVPTVDHLSHQNQDLSAITAARLNVPATSPYAGRTIGDSQVRTRTGATIVAVIREEKVYSGPDADFVLRDGDTLIVAGDREAIVVLAETLAEG